MSNTPDKSAPASIPAETPSNSAPPKKKGASRFVTPILALVVVLAVGVVGGILIGRSMSSTAAAGTRGNFPGGAGGFGGTGTSQEGGTGTGNRAGGNFTTGKVTANSDGTLTVTETDGTKVKVSTGTDTTVTTEGKVSDLSTGDTVTIIGTTNSDGSITATRISEGTTTFGGGFGGGTPGQAPTGAPSQG